MQITKKPTQKPVLSTQKKIVTQPIDKKLAKIQIFFRYHIGSLYRQLKLPIYEHLLQNRKSKKPQVVQALSKNTEQSIQILHKQVCLNSKYRHRQKIRFERTPLLKYAQFDFAKLKEQLSSKKNIAMYDDLHDSDQDQVTKIQYQLDPLFKEETITRHKKKNNINGKIVVAVGYDDLKAQLIDVHGWTQNPDATSLIYDLKVRSKKKNIDYVNLLDSQYINHFDENKAITAKFGLARNIRNLASLNKQYSVHFPRCFDVNDVAQLQDFYQDFKLTFIKSQIYNFISRKGSIFKQQIHTMKTMLGVLNQQMLPIDKKINLIQAGKPVYIPLDIWQQIERWSTYVKGQPIIAQELLQQATQFFQQSKKSDPQWQLNKDNIWIVKPASMSRGRGIKTFNNLNDILAYVIGCQVSWVVQKYIQRPLIIRKKKFDIRQWVVWTDFKPLRVWMYKQCYIRFCSTAYNPQDLANRQIHLTNNSVTKGINASKQDGIVQNMMDQQTFVAQLQSLYGKQVFRSSIKPQMQKTIYDSLQSVLENVKYRANTFQILGYDFMIDQELKVWLIEVNSSPTMEYSTKVTTKLVQAGMSGLADLIQNYVTKGKHYKADKKNQLYGGWRLI